MNPNELINLDTENYDQRFLLIDRVLKSLEFLSNKSEQLIRNDSGANSIPKQNKNKNQHQDKGQTLCDLQQLEINKINEGKYIDCTIMLPPVEMVSIMICIMDQNTNCQLAALYNYPSSSNKLKVGNQIKIYSPYYKIAGDGLPLIRVDNPKNIIVTQQGMDVFFKKIKWLIAYLLQFDQNICKNLIEKSIFQQIHIQDFKQDMQDIQNILDQPPIKQSVYTQPQEQKNPDWSSFYRQKPELDMDQNQINEIIQMMKSHHKFYEQFQSANFCSIKNPKQALDCYEQLVKQNSSYALIYFNYGELAFTNENYHLCLEAIKKFQEIHLKKQFTNSKIYRFSFYYLGVSQYRTQRFQEGEQNLLKAFNFDQKNKVFQIGLGQYYKKINNFKEAKKYFQMAIAEITDNVNDLVEVQRGYYNLFLMSIDSVNLNDIVKYGEGLVLLDESNYECIYATLIDLILSEELTFQEKILLCQKLFQSQSFCIISEEILELIVLNEVNTVNKIEGFSLMKKIMNVEYITQIEEQIPIEKEQISDIQPNIIEIQQNQEQLTENKLSSINQEQRLQSTQQQVQQVQQEQQKKILTDAEKGILIDKKIMQLLKPDNNQCNKEIILNEIKQKKRKMRSREEYQDINLQAKETYPGFIANIEYSHSQYIITIDPNLQLDMILFNKFKQAALKGLADQCYNCSGIILIKVKKDKFIYELKIINQQGQRLICKNPETIGKNMHLIQFNTLMSHKEVERWLKQHK